MARLFCVTGQLAGSSFRIGETATIGTDADNDVVLDASTVSRNHARIFVDDERRCSILEDLGSSNGTLLDGVPVVGHERLGRLHVITFAADHDFIYQGDPPAPPHDADALQG
jgi:pSer/pThr/pTyr-binding forkhead associated (FHA) protein